MTNNKSDFIILTPDQFGYHTDDYYRSYYARYDYIVHVICYDHGKEKINLNGVSVSYVNFSNGRIKNEFGIFKELKKYINNLNSAIIYTRFFVFCALFKLFTINMKTNWILDIRTGSLSTNSFIRIIYNTYIFVTASLFKEITIISNSLAKTLRISRYSVVPLGGQQLIDLSEINSKITKMNFLYVGIFDGRRIYETINAFSKFFVEYGNKINMSYTLVGYAINTEEEALILKAINDNIDSPIYYVGRVPNMKLKQYFCESNIGISYVPITPWYNIQPPTKSFEYLVNGLLCIATDTAENRKIINYNNGILIKDNEISLYESMINLYENRNNYDRQNIARQSQDYTWSNIYLQKLSPILKRYSK